MTAALPLTRASLEESIPDIACSPGDAALARVLALPRRLPADENLVELLSGALRLREYNDAGERNLLRPAQVEALRELWEYGGIFAPMRVGSGKSLVTMLAPTLLSAQRPVLIVPASLFEKTARDFARYRKDWNVRLPQLVSYEEMGRDDREHKLMGSTNPAKPSLYPDLLILDEAHHVRNDSGRTRKIARYVAAARAAERDGGPRLTVACLSGTLMTSSLVDYHHHALWCLGDRAPLPVRTEEAERWSLALDRNLGEFRRIELGALASIPGGYHEWFRGSRGVVPTPGADCDASITISLWQPDMPPALQQVIDEVSASGMRPDDVILGPLETPACLSTLALGFWEYWDPPPPEWWSVPRSDWYAYVRDVISMRLDGFDTPLQLVNALDRPPVPVSGSDFAMYRTPQAPNADMGRQMLAAWRAVKDAFVPNPVPVWVDDSPLRQVADKVRRRGHPSTLVWLTPVAAGRKLDELGVTYYGAGANPEPTDGRSSICCSIPAHAEGKNLQHYSNSLVLSIPANAAKHEQLIGRTHRAGQKAGTVAVEYIGSLEYHRTTLDRVLAEARADALASGFPQKLTLADWL
jgi:hypothetical protein